MSWYVRFSCARLFIPVYKTALSPFSISYLYFLVLTVKLARLPIYGAVIFSTSMCLPKSLKIKARKCIAMIKPGSEKEGIQEKFKGYINNQRNSDAAHLRGWGWRPVTTNLTLEIVSPAHSKSENTDPTEMFVIFQCNIRRLWAQRVRALS